MLSNRIDTNVVSSSKLNPNAAEFIPGASYTSSAIRNNVTTNQPLSINGAANNATHSNGPYFNDDHTDEPNWERRKLDDDDQPDDYVALCELKEFIDLISYNPASYDKRINHITDALNNWSSEDPETITECCVNSIVDQV